MDVSDKFSLRFPKVELENNKFLQIPGIYIMYLPITRLYIIQYFTVVELATECVESTLLAL